MGSMNKIKIEQDLDTIKKNYNAILKNWLELVENLSKENLKSNIDGSIKNINELYDFVAGKGSAPKKQGSLMEFINIFLKANLLYDVNYEVINDKDIVNIINDKDFYIFKIDQLEKYINSLETMNKSTDDNALAKVKTELENIGTQNLASYLSPIKPVFLVKALIKQKFEKDNIPQNMSD